MPKRFHLNRPDRAKAVAAALPACTDVKSHQRLLAMRASGPTKNHGDIPSTGEF